MRAWSLAWIVLAACGSAPAPRPTAATPAADPCAHLDALPVDLGLRCVAAGADAWIVEEEGVGDAPCESCDEEGARATVGDYRLVYVRADGSRVRGEPIHFVVGGPDRVTLEALAVYDYDHDGAAELAIYAGLSQYEGGDAWTDVLSAPPGASALVTIGSAAQFARSLETARDVDGDGRPDLVAHAPWQTGDFGYSESSGGFSGGPTTLFHALADGTFATGDAEGRAFWAERCGEIDTLVPTMTDPDDDESVTNLEIALERVTCAALLASDDVGARLEREWAAAPCTFDERLCARLHTDLVQRIADVAASRGRSSP
jgi:hypothetical protein